MLLCPRAASILSRSLQPVPQECELIVHACLAEIIIFCNPNNPTGACATREQLQSLVDFARESASFKLSRSVYITTPYYFRARAHRRPDSCPSDPCYHADKQVIIYDSAYAPFIQDPDKPKTIFECEGAKECAIETSSLSKLGGFTGASPASAVSP